MATSGHPAADGSWPKMTAPQPRHGRAMAVTTAPRQSQQRHGSATATPRLCHDSLTTAPWPTSGATGPDATRDHRTREGPGRSPLAAAAPSGRGKGYAGQGVAFAWLANRPAEIFPADGERQKPGEGELVWSERVPRQSQVRGASSFGQNGCHDRSQVRASSFGQNGCHDRVPQPNHPDPTPFPICNTQRQT